MCEKEEKVGRSLVQSRVELGSADTAQDATPEITT